MPCAAASESCAWESSGFIAPCMFTTALSRSQRGGASDGGDGTWRWWRLSGAEAEGVAESDIADCSDDRRREALSQQRDREAGAGVGWCDVPRHIARDM